MHLWFPGPPLPSPGRCIFHLNPSVIRPAVAPAPPAVACRPAAAAVCLCGAGGSLPCPAKCKFLAGNWDLPVTLFCLQDADGRPRGLGCVGHTGGEGGSSAFRPASRRGDPPHHLAHPVAARHAHGQPPQQRCGATPTNGARSRSGVVPRGFRLPSPCFANTQLGER